MIDLKPLKDIERLMDWRREVIRTVFDVEPDEALLKANRKYYESHIPDGSHLAFVAEMDGEEAGCGSICLTEELPSPDNPNGKCAYLMNIYVREAFREKGVGHAIVTRLMEEAGKHECDKIYLETTSIGRGLYESLGFHDLPDMMKLSKI